MMLAHIDDVSSHARFETVELTLMILAHMHDLKRYGDVRKHAKLTNTPITRQQAQKHTRLKTHSHTRQTRNTLTNTPLEHTRKHTHKHTHKHAKLKTHP